MLAYLNASFRVVVGHTISIETVEFGVFRKEAIGLDNQFAEIVLDELQMRWQIARKLTFKIGRCHIGLR